MARKRYSDEDALKLLREIDVHLHDGLDVVSACRKAGISDKTYYYWRKKFGGMGRPQLSEMRALQKENERLKKNEPLSAIGPRTMGECRSAARQVDPEGEPGSSKAEGLTREQLRQAVIHTRQKLDTSERRTCAVIGVARSSLRYQAKPQNDDALRLAMIRLAKQYGRYGYRKVTALLRMEGWRVNHKKVERLWGEEGLQLPHRHKKRRRLYHKDSSVIRMRPTHPNHVWAIDFVHDKLSNGQSYKMLTVLDEYTREALCVAVRPKMNANDVLDALHRLLMKHGKPEFIRSDNGPEFIAAPLQDWLRRVGIHPIQIYPGSPWENGYNERFNGTLRREVLNAEWFHSTKQAQVAINIWLRQYNRIRPHHALNMRPPIPETLLDKPQISGTQKGG